MNPAKRDDDFPAPTGYIECDGELMMFWLPENVDPDEIGLEWVGP